MIPVFTFTIIIVIYLYVITKFAENGGVFWFLMWLLFTFLMLGLFMWWVFT